MEGSLPNVGAGFYLAILLLLSTAGLALVTFPVLVARVRNDPERRARGRFTYWFMLGGYCLGGLATGMGIGGFDRPFIVNPLLGLLTGAVIGNVVGRIIGRRFKLHDEEVRV
jgi:uncharacterized membrane protein YfcA